MGIRIKKALGYGMVIDYGELESNVINDYDEIINKRFDNYQSYLNGIKENPEDNTDIAMELSILRSRDSIIKDIRSIDGYDAVKIIGDEYNEGDVLKENDVILLIIPPVSSMGEWYRTDDPMDYIEADNTDIKLTRMNSGIFPFNYSYMDKRTGEEFFAEDGNNHFFQEIEYLLSVYKKDNDTERVAAIMEQLEELAKKNGFIDYKEYKENIVPYVPDCVKTTANYLGLFQSQETFKNLSPMLIQWWD